MCIQSNKKKVNKLVKNALKQYTHSIIFKAIKLYNILKINDEDKQYELVIIINSTNIKLKII